MFLSASSTEEVIALFISIAFVGDAVKGTVKSKSRSDYIKHVVDDSAADISAHCGGMYKRLF